MLYCNGESQAVAGAGCGQRVHGKCCVTVCVTERHFQYVTFYSLTTMWEGPTFQRQAPGQVSSREKLPCAGQAGATGANAATGAQGTAGGTGSTGPSPQVRPHQIPASGLETGALQSYNGFSTAVQAHTRQHAFGQGPSALHSMYMLNHAHFNEDYSPRGAVSHTCHQVEQSGYQQHG